MALKTPHNLESDLSWLTDPEFRSALRGHKIIDFPTKELKPLPTPVLLYITTGVSTIKVAQFNGEDPPYAVVQSSRRHRRDYPRQWQGEWRMNGVPFERPPARAGYKYCPVCNEEWKLEAFTTRNGSRDGRHSYCKSCEAVRLRRWRATSKKAA